MSRYTKNNSKDFGRKKRYFKGSKKLKNWKVMSVKPKPKTIKNT